MNYTENKNLYSCSSRNVTKNTNKKTSGPGKHTLSVVWHPTKNDAKNSLYNVWCVHATQFVNLTHITEFYQASVFDEMDSQNESSN